MATINLPTLAHTVSMNGLTYTATSTGNVSLGNVLKGIKVGTSTYNVSSSGVIALGSSLPTGSGGLFTDTILLPGNTHPNVYLLFGYRGAYTATNIANLMKSSFPSAPVGSVGLSFCGTINSSSDRTIYYALKKTSSTAWTAYPLLVGGYS